MAALKFVAQKNRSSGCGPACIAMLGGSYFSKQPEKAYAEAVELIFGERRVHKLLTRWRDLRRALDGMSVRYADQIQRHRSWKTITTLSLVKCGDPNDEVWHWVVYDGRKGVLYDPLEDGPRTPHSDLDIQSHLPIYL